MIYYVDGSTSLAGNYILITDNIGNVLFFKKINKTKTDMLTNNVTEYIAIIECLEMADENSIIFSDSKVAVNQISGIFQIKEKHLKEYKNKAFELSKNKNIQIIWIGRDSNLAGQHLERFIKTNANKRHRKQKAINK